MICFVMLFFIQMFLYYATLQCNTLFYFASCYHATLHHVMSCLDELNKFHRKVLRYMYLLIRSLLSLLLCARSEHKVVSMH